MGAMHAASLLQSSLELWDVCPRSGAADMPPDDLSQTWLTKTTQWGLIGRPTTCCPAAQAPEVLICPDKDNPMENKDQDHLAYSEQVSKRDLPVTNQRLPYL